MKPFRYIIRKRALGDVLWIEPVIRVLAPRHTKLIVHTKFNELFENYPIDNVVFKPNLTIPEKILINAERILHSDFFSINLDNSYERTPKIHLLHAFQQKAGLPITNEYPKLYLSKYEKTLASSLPSRYIVLHLESFSTKNYRRVYGIDWAAIVDFLRAQHFEVIQIGIDPAPLKNTIIKKTTIRELITMIYHSELFIGLDSGPSHIAASLGIRTLLFFGAVDPLLRHFPDLLNGIIMQGACEFAGCYHELFSDIRGPECKIVGNEGIPKCSFHSTESVILQLKFLLKNDRKNHQAS